MACRYAVDRWLLTAVAVLAAVGFTPSPTNVVAPPSTSSASRFLEVDQVEIDPLPCPTLTWRDDDPSFEPLPGARAFSGRDASGLYRIEIPANWNGDLVLFAHGFRGAGGENGTILRVGNHPIREHLVEEGFAWAASSYRCNGYVPGQGLEDTMALVGLFTRSNDGRAPGRVYLTGTSMGGHVTLLGMHEYPTSFAGGLAMCPAGPGLFDFFAAVGAAAEVITDVRFTADGTQGQAASMRGMLGEPPAYTDRGRQLASVQIEISGGRRPFAMEGLESRFLSNISGGALAGGSSPSNRAVDTRGFAYGIEPGLGITAEDIERRVRRKAGDPAMRRPDGPYEELHPFDGGIERPLLSMHGTGDLFVPIFLQRLLKDAVHEAGRDEMLVQRIYRIPGHCGFSQPEMIRAFDDLVAWVTTGARPAGDDVSASLLDAGRTFTNPLREGDPGTVGAGR
jgi:pimeloyl-ACP methyl ester carboxylesterase